MSNTQKELYPDCTYDLREDEDTGKRYWYGYCEGDKDGDGFAPNEPLILKPESFPVGYRVKGYSPIPDEET